MSIIRGYCYVNMATHTSQGREFLMSGHHLPGALAAWILVTLDSTQLRAAFNREDHDNTVQS